MSRHLALLFATSGHSGVDRVVQNLLPEFGRTPHRFDLLLIRGHGPYLDTVPDNIRVIRLPVGSKKTVLPCLFWYLWRHRPEAMLTANHELNRALLLARRITGVPTRVVIRMGMSVSAKGRDLQPAQRDALFASMRRWYPLADAAVTPSQGVGDDLVKIAGVQPGRLSVIRNPIVNERFFQLAEEPVEHSWYGDTDWPVILGVGSLEPRKDFTTLIKAFAVVRAERRCRLIILGKGRQRSDLLALAAQLGVAEDVDLPGFDPNPYRHMRRAGLFVLASQREGASAVVVEALACGTPVVSTDCPSGPAETLANGRYGRLVPVGDVAKMAKAINATLDYPPDPDYLRQAVVANRTEVVARRYLAALGVSD
ncbi:glycosyltransferase [Desulfurivibrio dismutans]|uniref:glycosyltransferase n=1 Tax=Desulfurivibrio dismutans TaxID=1398908 RepID=UPI0023DBFF18|nr:glycosyltransferase [Desulfurivibrio alkaliphilus]MDF1614768.1 glycosyltransferase [Desulfurivibrio alkaliphilus]